MFGLIVSIIKMYVYRVLTHFLSLFFHHFFINKFTLFIHIWNTLYTSFTSTATHCCTWIIDTFTPLYFLTNSCLRIRSISEHLVSIRVCYVQSTRIRLVERTQTPCRSLPNWTDDTRLLGFFRYGIFTLGSRAQSLRLKLCNSLII